MNIELLLITAKDYFEIAFLFVNAFILCATVYAIRKSPADAIRIGRNLNIEQQKDNAKRNLFLTLFSLRGTPLHYDFVIGLNQIEIVFGGIPSVLNAWKELRTSLNSKEQSNSDYTWTLLRTNLLSSMAVSLGYSQILQTEMIQDYYPEGHDFQLRSDFEFRKDQHEYYKSATELNKLLLDLNRQNPQLNAGELEVVKS